MKKILYILSGLLVLAIVGVAIILFSLGSIVKAGINSVGPRITQSKVELQDASISPFSGTGTLKGLTVGNPAGWQTPRAFYLKEISIELEPKSLKGDHIVINRILIDQPEITYETTVTNSNLQDLLKNIQQAAGGDTKTAPQTTAPAKEGKPVKIEIKSFRFQNATITLAGGGQTVSVPMPELVLENLGTKEGGLTPEELSTAILKEITSRVTKAAASTAAKNGLLNKAGESLRGLFGGKK